MQVSVRIHDDDEDTEDDHKMIDHVFRGAHALLSGHDDSSPGQIKSDHRIL